MNKPKLLLVSAAIAFNANACTNLGLNKAVDNTLIETDSILNIENSIPEKEMKEINEEIKEQEEVNKINIENIKYDLELSLDIIHKVLIPKLKERIYEVEIKKLDNQTKDKDLENERITLDKYLKETIRKQIIIEKLIEEINSGESTEKEIINIYSELLKYLEEFYERGVNDGVFVKEKVENSKEVLLKDINKLGTHISKIINSINQEIIRTEANILFPDDNNTEIPPNKLTNLKNYKKKLVKLNKNLIELNESVQNSEISIEEAEKEYYRFYILLDTLTMLPPRKVEKEDIDYLISDINILINKTQSSETGSKKNNIFKRLQSLKDKIGKLSISSGKGEIGELFDEYIEEYNMIIIDFNELKD